MGLDRSTWLEEQHGATVTWLPYDLHPEIPEGGVDRDPARYAGGVIPELCEAAGLPLHPSAHVPRTRKALEAGEWVRHAHPDAFPKFHRALFHAHWAEGRDIEETEVLAAIARTHGIPDDDLVAALLVGAARANVDKATEMGRQLGISGTPAWLIDGKVLVPGAQDREVFDRVITRMNEKRASGEDSSG